MVELAAAFKQFVDIQTEKQAIQAQIRKLQSHNDAIRPIVDVPYDLSGLLQRLDNFELAFLEMENILQDHRARIGEETKRKGDSLEQ